jgi:NO-binding membrane sensor protein with MHYT domain
VDTLATETRAFINHSQGRDKVLWLLAGCVGGLAIKIMFFMGSMGMHP